MVPLKYQNQICLENLGNGRILIDNLDPFHLESKVFEDSEFEDTLGWHVFRFTWHTIGFCYNAQRRGHGNPH